MRLVPSGLRFASLIVVLFAFVWLGPQMQGAPEAVPERGTVQHIKVYGKSLEGNLEGDSPERDVSVYLPAGYQSHPKQRYPVIYLLHGFTDNDANWFGATHVFVDAPAAIDKAFFSGSAREMILVMPNAYTLYQGSMYSNSVTTGNWEDFVVRDLVSYVDSHYRTIPARESRGLAGHSMGGYGTIRLGMKFPEVFSSIYILSACCLSPNPSVEGPAIPGIEAIPSAAEVAKGDFATRAVFASAAAWSPNPDNPPFFLDLPWVNGERRPIVGYKWTANAPLAMIDQYITNLRKLSAIGMDIGTQDPGLVAMQELDKVLTSYQIPHKFETYDGTHISRIGERLETKVLPFFSSSLRFSATRH